MASTFTTLAEARCGCRATWTTAASYSTRRQPPQSRLVCCSCAWSHRRAAPMPRVLDIVSEKVFRVPNDTRAESVARMRAGLTSASAAMMDASRSRPMRGSPSHPELAGMMARPLVDGAMSTCVVLEVVHAAARSVAARTSGVVRSVMKGVCRGKRESGESTRINANPSMRIRVAGARFGVSASEKTLLIFWAIVHPCRRSVRGAPFARRKDSR